MPQSRQAITDPDDMHEMPIEVVQGAHVVAGAAGPELVATLGSCVAVCLYAPGLAIGGMSHIYRHVTDTPLGDGPLIAEIEILVNHLMRQGATRDALAAKVAGGAHVLGFGMSARKRHGTQMSEAAMKYLAAERIPVTGASVGGEVARRIRFQPWSGELFVTYVADAVDDTVEDAQDRPGNSPELF
ncbi:MAG: chemotaxis protein CheD [Pseudomonadota bacterium]